MKYLLTNIIWVKWRIDYPKFRVRKCKEYSKWWLEATATAAATGRPYLASNQSLWIHSWWPSEFHLFTYDFPFDKISKQSGMRKFFFGNSKAIFSSFTSRARFWHLKYFVFIHFSSKISLSLKYGKYLGTPLLKEYFCWKCA